MDPASQDAMGRMACALLDAHGTIVSVDREWAEAGSIAAPLLSMGSLVLLVENHQINSSRLRVFDTRIKLGALKEIVEYGIMVAFPASEIGGYVNTSLDLVSDLIGAIIAMLLIRYAGKPLGLR